MMNIMPNQTPWGRADWSKQIAVGIFICSTSSHGGMWLSSERRKEMPACLAAINTWGDDRPMNWFEEDCDYAIVVCSFPEYFQPYELYWADYMMREYHSKPYADFLGTKEGDAFMEIVDRFYAANHGKFDMGGCWSTKEGWHNLASTLDRQRRIEFDTPTLFREKMFTTDDLDRMGIKWTEQKE